MKLPEKAVKAAVGIGASMLANEFIKRLSKEASESIINEGVKGASNKVAEKTKEIFSSSDDFKNRYENLRKVSLSTESNIKSFRNAIFEAKNMQNHYQFDLDSINVKNPTNLPKYKLITSKYEKSKALLTSLRNEANDRIIREATIVYESKNESEFFNPYPKINTELINCDSKTEFHENLLKINKYYLKDFQTVKDSL